MLFARCLAELPSESCKVCPGRSLRCRGRGCSWAGGGPERGPAAVPGTALRLVSAGGFAAIASTTRRRAALRHCRTACKGDATSDVRVVTYNVLSPTLCSARRFPHCKEQDLLESVRWPRLVTQLDAALAETTPTVFCLQEVDELWASKLHAHFQRRGWHFAYAMTPLTYFPPIGVALAFPGDLELEELLMVRPAAQLKLAPPRSPSTRWQRFKDWILDHTVRNHTDSDEGAAWTLAARKQNRLLAAKLKVKSGSSFVVATYHMPCLFDEPLQRQAKAIHAALLREALMLHFPEEQSLVLAGDFNTKPEDSELQVLTEGALSESDVAWPTALTDQGLDFAQWEAGSLQLRSAYAQQGGELEYTNYAWIEESRVLGGAWKWSPKRTFLSIRLHHFSGILREVVPYRWLNIRGDTAS
ncbi:unnamed protein product [Symbiodinium sp. CCMP2456]|nr:unnamed protein product [Symbiodinium sp. CCMP2456]